MKDHVFANVSYLCEVAFSHTQQYYKSNSQVMFVHWMFLNFCFNFHPKKNILTLFDMGSKIYV